MILAIVIIILLQNVECTPIHFKREVYDQQSCTTLTRISKTVKLQAGLDGSSAFIVCSIIVYIMHFVTFLLLTIGFTIKPNKRP